MKSFKASLILVATATTSSVLAGQAATKATFQGYYDKYNALVMKRDIAGIENSLLANHTSDYVSVDLKKTTDLKTEIETMKKVLKFMAKFDKATSTITKFAPGKGTATVTVKSVIVCTSIKDGNGVAHKLEDHNLSVDTWVRNQGKWKLKLSKTIKDDFYADGKLTPQG